MKKIFDIGINDQKDIVSKRDKSKRLICPYYQRWYNMLRRCYSVSYHDKFPSYIGCSVCEDWLTFSNFKAWMETQDWEEKELDKDILFPGNKVYSPETCVFIDNSLNSFLNDRGLDRGELPLGVTKNGNGYSARCSYKGVQLRLGTFKTPVEAHNVWRNKKKEIALEFANQVSDVRVANALRSRVF